jgi:chromatin remodeling complex protein RSC6
MIGAKISKLAFIWMDYIKNLNVGKDESINIKKRAAAFKKVLKLNNKRNDLCVELDEELKKILESHGII